MNNGDVCERYKSVLKAFRICNKNSTFELDEKGFVIFQLILIQNFCGLLHSLHWLEPDIPIRSLYFRNRAVTPLD